jgi:ribonuclease HII
MGISRTAGLGVKRVLAKLDVNPEETFIFLDGLLKAPEKYFQQKTIIRGDEKIKIISCASVLAKVRRDQFMIRVSRFYPAYHFDKHKGYGTKLHRALIKKYQTCQMHRKSFLKGFIS